MNGMTLTIRRKLNEGIKLTYNEVINRKKECRHEKTWTRGQ